jgi:hypothetical protein
MQAAKDTFLMTLAGRLATVNPARTACLDGTTRAAVMTLENETPGQAANALETFVLSWQAAKKVMAGKRLMEMKCEVTYATRGTDAMLRADRGRILTAMDCELLTICRPECVAQCDYTQTPPAQVGTRLFWSQPVLGEVTDEDGTLKRKATLELFFFAEAA